LLIYPNPVRERLFIDQLQSVQKVNAQIISLDGKIIHRPMADSLAEGIDLRSLPAGIYILKLRIGEEIFIRRFIKN
jgi:hypothetical protein